jgi:hypothetical protein
MILRHVTLKRRIPSIIESNALNAEAFIIRTRSNDGSYNAFEVNPTSDVLVRIFPIIKSNPIESFSEEDIFELSFDGDRMFADGLILEDMNQNKVQLWYLVTEGVLTEEEFLSLGEFKFIRGEVSLEYLTNECKRRLDEFIKSQ